MAVIGSKIASEVGLRLLLGPLGGTNIVLRTACCSVGIALPVYCTCKAIERKDHTAQHKWLLYWAAYGSFSLVEIFSDKLISWCPMYYHMKFAFLVWLQLPSADGANQLYMNHLRPFLLRHQAKVDRVLGLTYGELLKLINAHQAEIQYAKAMVMKILGSDQVYKGRASSDLLQRNAIEGQTRTTPIEGQTRTAPIEGQTGAIVDSESGHD